MPNAIGWAALAGLYALGVVWLGAADVTAPAWLGLLGACAGVAGALWRGAAGRCGPRGWFAAAVYAGLFAAIFYGANGALDALHGPRRGDPGIARALGNLELWQLLCPGAVSVALAGWLRALAIAARRAPAARPPETLPAPHATIGPRDAPTRGARGDGTRRSRR